MHVIVVGAGAAGLAAAWKLVESGARVTVLERSDHPGGRCHSVYWHEDWRITGALAFISIEENLKEQARQLGIYGEDAIADMTGLHAHHILVDRDHVVTIADFEPGTILSTPALPVREKMALARVLPKVLKQILRNDWRDPTTACDFDNITATEFFRRHSPTFVDHLLEPIMQHFNGFSEDDFSLAWLVWLLAGQPWSSSWWTFKERGVGCLTHEMARQIAGRKNASIEYNTAAIAIRHDGTGIEVDVAGNGKQATLTADAAVCAVPGSAVPDLVRPLDDDHRAFFESVRYKALYLAYYYVKLPEGELPEALILPTVDGFRTTAYYNIQPLSDGMAVVHAEMKGDASRAARRQSDEEVRQALWQDIVEATPAMAACRIDDFLLLRNDLAILVPYVGYLTALKKFRSLDPLPRLAFAGDYLITSTVGQAHYTGIKAAERLLRQTSP